MIIQTIRNFTASLKPLPEQLDSGSSRYHGQRNHVFPSEGFLNLRTVTYMVCFLLECNKEKELSIFLGRITLKTLMRSIFFAEKTVLIS